MKTATELQDDWARSRGYDSPEESRAKRQAYLEAKAKEDAAGKAHEKPQDEAGAAEEHSAPPADHKPPSSPGQAGKKKR